MRCWVVEQITEAGEMIWVERPDPVPGQDELLVRVKAAGVNFADTLMARGRYQRKPETPFTPGIEVAGEIVASGAGGERRGWVCANIPTGGYAELALVPERAATPIPDDVPSTSPWRCSGSTIRPPTTLCIIVRKFAPARRCSSTPARAESAAPRCRPLWRMEAASSPLRGRRRSWRCAGSSAPRRSSRINRLTGRKSSDRRPAEPEWMDVIFDPVGGRIGVDSLRCLAWRGRLLTVGFASGSIPELPSNRLLLKEGSALGVFWGEAAKRDPALLREVHAALLTLYRAKQVAPLIGARFALANAPSALAALRARKSVGKIVLAPSLEQLSD